MEKQELEKLLSEGLSSREIAIKLGKSQTTIRYWVNKLGLKFNGTIKNCNKIDVDQLKKLLETSVSVKELLHNLKLSISSNSYLVLKNIALQNNLELPNGRKHVKCKPIDEDFEYKVFIENSNVSRNSVKRRLIKEGRGSFCEICNITDWNDKPINMRLDHINGIPNDNRKVNLRFICPNCDSQLDTYCGKNTKRS